MEVVGKIINLAKSGRIIIQLDKMIKENEVVFDKNNNKIAKIGEIIGPISKPYASGIPLTNITKKYIGKDVFINE